MASLESAVRDVRTEIVTTRGELRADILRVGARVDTVIYGVILAILVPIVLRILFH